ncbi:protein IMPACT [Trichonephila clavipes]|nr:protein IMPACT [Trichonephila clavipes]
MDSETLQANEIEALSSIFEDKWELENLRDRRYSINITSSSGKNVYFRVVLPEDYPVNAPPTYLFSAPWMSRNTRNNLSSMLDEICIEYLGESVLYEWILKIQDFIEELENNNLNPKSTRNCDSNIPVAQEIDTYNMLKEELPTVYHGETIVDRKSVFQGHAATVVSMEQAKKVLIELKRNKKIVNATHNIMAYRIINDSNLVIQDCDDDGESRGGSTLLHLLQILDVKNVIVVVSRWYGGIHLGPDRFKHISNAARMVLTSSGYITKKGTEKKKHKKR